MRLHNAVATVNILNGTPVCGTKKRLSMPKSKHRKEGGREEGMEGIFV